MKNKLINDLKNMNLNKNDIVMIHSSLKSINFDADIIIDALVEYFSEGMVLMPSHTWKQMDQNNNYFDPLVEESCVGMLTNIFRNRKGVVRSLHPTHSIVGYGKGVEEYLSGEEDVMTPTPVGGAWGRLKDVKAKILLVGCGLRRNTFIHSIEERMDVSDRLDSNYIKFKIKKDDKIIEKKFYKHYNSKYRHLSEHFDKVEDILFRDNIISYHKFGDAKVMLMNAYDLSVYLENMLKKNIELFSDPFELEM